jgi:two-component system, OmpR family, sensor histidine kinase BaeS
MKYDLRPLDRVSSIKTKLGLLVAVTIVVASVLAVIGTRLGISPWATVPVAVVVALAVTQLLARGMTSPLREMTLAAQRMAQGDYSQRVHTSSRDEVGELAQAFNRTAATLEMVDRHRRDLVANVSHELRTPIAALQAVLENLVDGVSNPGPGELRTALAQTERLGRLVGDLLDLSRVQEGVTPLQLKEVRLIDIFDDAVAQARADGVRYAVEVRPENLTVAADPDRLHQLLANLLDNAARHSPSGGEVRLSAERLVDDVHLTVADEGPGIAAADRSAVFERFTTSAGHSSGTGLGLTISRWVAELHGGTIAVADSQRGCRIRVTLPADALCPTTTRKEPVMSTLTPPAPAPQNPVVPPGLNSSGLTTYWPDAPRRRPVIVGAAAAAGLLAATVLPARHLGLGTVVVFAAVVGTVFAAGTTRAAGRRWTRLDAFDAALAALLLATLLVRDAVWITVLCLLAALALTAVNSTKAASVLALLGTAAAVPLAAVRGLPWLRRTLKPSSGVQAWLPAARTAVVSAVLLLVFGALFASADALFASWVNALTPDITWNDLPGRAVLATFIAAGTLAAAFVALAPPAVDRLRLPRGTSRNDFEWLTPVLVLDAVFLAFLVAQATAMFGGHDYLRQTTGLTYAEYVHEGFGQLTVATILTLTVVAWAARKAAPGRRRDFALGALCVMTIVVVVSALYRMHLYEEAFGFTRLRLLVSVFEGWLGVVVVLVIVAGVVGARRWLVPVAVRLGAAGLLGLAIVNPDLYIAQHNIARADAPVGIDWKYLGELSTDAYPALVRLPDEQFECATRYNAAPGDDDWLALNLSRERARDLKAGRPPAGAPATFIACPSVQAESIHP